MNNKTNFVMVLFLLGLAGQAKADSVAGLYKAIFEREGSKYYQFADITLRTTNPTGQEMKVDANVRLYFGKSGSQEFLSYTFSDCPRTALTGKLECKEVSSGSPSDVTLVGTLKAGTFEGEWSAKLAGRVGKFYASKGAEPTVPSEGVLVKMLSGNYRGQVKPGSAVDKVSLNLITTQDPAGIKISGSTRIYEGDFESQEYVEAPLETATYNFYNGYFTAQTKLTQQLPVITYRGSLALDGTFKGEMSANQGLIGEVEFKPYP